MLCEETSMDGDWINDLDLSALTSEQFSSFFFNRPIVAGADARYHMFLGEFECFALPPSYPAAVVANLQAMCRNFAELAKIYSREQLEQGLWAMFGAVLTCGEYLFDPAIERRLRVDCVESMYLPFRDVVAGLTIQCQGIVLLDVVGHRPPRNVPSSQGIQMRLSDSRG